MVAINVLAAARAAASLTASTRPPPPDAALAADLAAALPPVSPADAAVPTLPGLLYARAFVPLSLQDRLTSAVDAAVAGRWVAGDARRTANVGGRPGDEARAREQLPPFLAAVAAALAPAMGGAPPNHVLVNELAPGGGLPPHADGALYAASAVVSLGGPSTLDVRRGRDAVDDAVPPDAQVVTRPGDVVVLTGAAYHSMTHAVPAVAADVVRPDCVNAGAAGVATGDVLTRAERRLSLVFVRKVGGGGEKAGKGEVLDTSA